jgi:hypothetical protein
LNHSRNIYAAHTRADKEDPISKTSGLRCITTATGEQEQCLSILNDSCFFLRDFAEEGACSDRHEDTLVGEVGACTRETVMFTSTESQLRHIPVQ